MQWDLLKAAPMQKDREHISYIHTQKRLPIAAQRLLIKVTERQSMQAYNPWMPAPWFLDSKPAITRYILLYKAVEKTVAKVPLEYGIAPKAFPQMAILILSKPWHYKSSMQSLYRVMHRFITLWWTGTICIVHAYLRVAIVQKSTSA
jgi:hypothetical protein